MTEKGKVRLLFHRARSNEVFNISTATITLYSGQWEKKPSLTGFMPCLRVASLRAAAAVKEMRCDLHLSKHVKGCCIHPLQQHQLKPLGPLLTSSSCCEAASPSNLFLTLLLHPQEPRYGPWYFSPSPCSLHLQSCLFLPSLYSELQKPKPGENYGTLLLIGGGL